MRVLWLSNVDLSNSCKATGSWLYSMAESLTNGYDIDILNITQSSNIKEVTSKKIKSNLTQYLLPFFKLKHGVPSDENIAKIQAIVEQQKPDIIHIWGTESYWGLLSARGYLHGKILLEMQGILATCYNAYYANLSPYQIFHCISIKEIILPHQFLPIRRLCLKGRIENELEIIKSHKYIAVQSSWVEDYVNLISNNNEIFHSAIAVRSPFYETSWKIRDRKENITLVTVASNIPYKGIHDLIRVVSLLKRKYANLKLLVIGSFNMRSTSIRISGYSRFILSLIKKFKVKENIEFLGPLDADHITKVFKSSDVFIQSSYVESYSLALAEAMAFGIPCVASNAGAMKELGQDGVSVSYFNPGDVFSCASKIIKILECPSLAIQYSLNSREIAKARNTPSLAVERQMEIYKKLCTKC